MQTNKPIDWIASRAGRFLRRRPVHSHLDRQKVNQNLKASISLFFVGVLLAVAAGCSTAQRVRQTETLLVASGFKTVMASTPAQQAHLKMMPPGKIALVKRNDKTYYVYPDAAHDRIYVGNRNQYLAYRQYYQDEQLSNGQIEGADLHEDAAIWSFWGYGDFED
jgi:hypothetical protein